MRSRRNENAARLTERRLEMKKIVILLVLTLSIFTLLLATTVPGYAHERFVFRGGVWIGPGWGWGPGWGPWWGPTPYPYYYDPYYPAPPVVIQQQPPVYVQPAPQPEEQNYWYFCTKPEGYYPYIKQCPGGWKKVIPPSAPPDEGMQGMPPTGRQDERR